MQTILFIIADTGEIVGAVNAPECFEPDGAFHRSVSLLGLRTDITKGALDPAIHGRLLLTGEMILDSMRAALASLN